MVLTPEQQAELDALTAKRAEPEPRTETGMAGVLHTILDVLGGTVAHLPAEAWAALHSRVEGELGDQAADAADPPGSSASSGSSGSSASSGSKKSTS